MFVLLTRQRQGEGDDVIFVKEREALRPRHRCVPGEEEDTRPVSAYGILIYGTFAHVESLKKVAARRQVRLNAAASGGGSGRGSGRGGKAASRRARR